MHLVYSPESADVIRGESGGESDFKGRQGRYGSTCVESIDISIFEPEVELCLGHAEVSK